MILENEVTYVFTCPLEIKLRPCAAPDTCTVRINSSDAEPYAQLIRNEIFESLRKAGNVHDLFGPLKGIEKTDILLPSVAEWDGEFMGICSLICQKEKLYSDIAEVADYILEQFHHGWGADFSKRGISTPIGTLYVTFGGDDTDELSIIPCY